MEPGLVSFIWSADWNTLRLHAQRIYYQPGTYEVLSTLNCLHEMAMYHVRNSGQLVGINYLSPPNSA